MANLNDILLNTRHRLIAGSTDIEINNIRYDSRDVSKGDVFVALIGTQVDGHNFIGQAVSQGAVAVILQDAKPINENITIVEVEDSHRALAEMANQFYHAPSSSLNVIGVTGTNGKTSVVNLLYQASRSLNKKSGMISTVDVKINDTTFAATHTTPDPLKINYYLAKMRDEGVENVFMEVSSHALDQKRVHDIHFSGAVFTNITHDHLDYHKTFDNYIKAKKILFDELSEESFAIYNRDDRNGKVMVQNCSAELKSFALNKPADYKAKIIQKSIEGLELELNGKHLYSPLCGEFNAYNLVAVYAVFREMGFSEEDSSKAISAAKPVEGRFQKIVGKFNRFGIVDYAHTPDALENVLKTLREVHADSGLIITVMGCGGDRDKTKRPKMGKIAAHYSDKLIITSDNPRTEDPNEIIENIEKGIDENDIHKCLKITDRLQAIKTACQLANEGDLILVSGKGHEKYQIIGSKKNEFDDVQILREQLKAGLS